MRPVLALDPATRLGWACRDHEGNVTSGVLQLPGGGGAARVDAYERWLETKLREVRASYGRGVLVYEGPLGGGPRRAAAHRVACHLEAVTLLVARRLSVEDVLTATPAETKRHATGKGNADKASVLAAMRARWGREDLTDDNESDALALLSYALAERQELVGT